MKYRVKKITRANGEEEFFPQCKWFLFWSDCYVMHYYKVKRKTFQEAEDWIIDYELNKLTRQLEKQRNRVVECEYIPLENQ